MKKKYFKNFNLNHNFIEFALYCFKEIYILKSIFVISYFDFLKPTQINLCNKISFLKFF
jgi:hypothetical protein